MPAPRSGGHAAHGNPASLVRPAPAVAANVSPPARDGSGAERRLPRRARQLSLRRDSGLPSITDTPAWQALVSHCAELRERPLRSLFAEDPQRFERFSIRVGDILLDYSKNRIVAETMSRLYALAEAAGVREWARRMFAGEAINVTEGRAVLHTALRNRSDAAVRVHGRDVMPAVRETLAQMRRFSEAVRSGAWRGADGHSIRAVVNIGIGGSDLGPAMAVDALEACRDRSLAVRFVSNVDGSHLAMTLADLEPESTLFIVVSKTFTTQETLGNARSARAWLEQRLGPDAVARHFVAVTSEASRARDFGIDADNVFAFWDWVGGRYSLWSAVGLAVALSVGMERFEQMLDGAHSMDRHFLDSPLESNLPVTLALLGVWYMNFLGAEAHAVIPYDQRLRRLPAYLQQLDMESNGKCVDRDGRRMQCHTGPIIFGEPGTNAQHAFFQLLHQGTRLVPADLIAAAMTDFPVGEHHTILMANFLAQSTALMQGRTRAEARALLVKGGLEPAEADRLAPHRSYPGDRPSNSILMRRLDPRSLGALIAMYEHKVFVQGVIWGINSFDQWGVELGKQIAGGLLPALRGLGDGDSGVDDSSTRGLLEQYRRWAADG